MQWAMLEMNSQQRHVASDITGATGMRIIRAVVASERDPDMLAAHSDVRSHSSPETIRPSLVGNDRDEQIFALTKSLALDDFYQAKMVEYDRKLEVRLQRFRSNRPHPPVCYPRPESTDAG